MVGSDDGILARASKDAGMDGLFRDRQDAGRRLARALELDAALHGGRPALDLSGRTALLVDDGLATGATMRAAAAALRAQDPSRIVVAVPVAAASSCEEFSDVVDEVVCVETPEPFLAVGQWYEDFSQTEDEEVHRLLEQSRRERSRSGRPRLPAPAPPESKRVDHR
jgi:predicted phosphoribosyltransferase